MIAPRYMRVVAALVSGCWFVGSRSFRRSLLARAVVRGNVPDRPEICPRRTALMGFVWYCIPR